MLKDVERWNIGAWASPALLGRPLTGLAAIWLRKFRILEPNSQEETHGFCFTFWGSYFWGDWSSFFFPTWKKGKKKKNLSMPRWFRSPFPQTIWGQVLLVTLFPVGLFTALPEEEYTAVTAKLDSTISKHFSIQNALSLLWYFRCVFSIGLPPGRCQLQPGVISAFSSRPAESIAALSRSSCSRSVPAKYQWLIVTLVALQSETNDRSWLAYANTNSVTICSYIYTQ